MIFKSSSRTVKVNQLIVYSDNHLDTHCIDCLLQHKFPMSCCKFALKDKLRLDLYWIFFTFAMEIDVRERLGKSKHVKRKPGLVRNAIRVNLNCWIAWMGAHWGHQIVKNVHLSEIGRVCGVTRLYSVLNMNYLKWWNLKLYWKTQVLYTQYNFIAL